MVVGFWEASVTGFDEHYAPQAGIYHVTDKAALEGSARPRHAGRARAHPVGCRTCELGLQVAQEATDGAAAALDSALAAAGVAPGTFTVTAITVTEVENRAYPPPSAPPSSSQITISP